MQHSTMTHLHMNVLLDFEKVLQIFGTLIQIERKVLLARN